jgi:hypothetical protein
MVDVFDWRVVAKALKGIARAEETEYEKETGKKLVDNIYYWPSARHVFIEIDEKRLPWNKKLAIGTVLVDNKPSEDILIGDFYLTVFNGNGFKPHARRICDEYEAEF